MNIYSILSIFKSYRKNKEFFIKNEKIMGYLKY